MKNLKKALAAVVALSVMSVSAVAFADVEKQSFAFDDAKVTGDYNESANSATATVTGALDESQMTFLVLDKDVVLDPEEESYDVEAADILYIDQKEFDASKTNTFTGVINPARITGSGGVMVKGSYPVRVGYFDSLGDFQIARGTLVLEDKVVTEITGIAFTTAGPINAYIGTGAGTGADVSAQVQGTGDFDEDAYTLSIKAGYNTANATLLNGHVSAMQTGSVTIVATATEDNTQTAELVVNFIEPQDGLQSISITAQDGVSVEVDTVVDLTSTVLASTSGATVSYAIVPDKGTLSATATLVDNGDGTATITSSTAGTVYVKATATVWYKSMQSNELEITFTEPAAPSYTVVSFMLGDVNGADGCTLYDATCIASALAGGTPNKGGAYSIGEEVEDINEKVFVFGDVNGADGCTLYDATCIASALAGGTPNKGATDGDGNAVAIGETMTFKVEAE